MTALKVMKAAEQEKLQRRHCQRPNKVGAERRHMTDAADTQVQSEHLIHEQRSRWRRNLL